jgi:hypothetical protein
VETIHSFLEKLLPQLTLELVVFTPIISTINKLVTEKKSGQSAWINIQSSKPIVKDSNLRIKLTSPRELITISENIIILNEDC